MRTSASRSVASSRIACSASVGVFPASDWSDAPYSSRFRSEVGMSSDYCPDSLEKGHSPRSTFRLSYAEPKVLSKIGHSGDCARVGTLATIAGFANLGRD